MQVNSYTREQGEKLRNTMIVYMVIILTCAGLGYDFYTKTHKDPTIDNTLTNYQVNLHKGIDYTAKDKELHNLPDKDGFSYFKYLKKGFNNHTFSLTNVAEAKTIKKHTNFKGESDEVTNIFTTKDIIITTDYKRTNENVHTLGGPQANVKQTFTLTNTTNKEKITTFTSRTEIPTNQIQYDGQTYTITKDKQYFKSEEKTSTIPEFAQRVGVEHPEEAENFKNYTHTYQTGSKMIFESEDEEGNEALAVYDWGDAKHLNHEVTIYSEYIDNSEKIFKENETKYFIEFIVKDIIIPPNETFIIDPSYGLDDSANYDVRYDGEEINAPQLTLDGAIAVGDVNGDHIPDLVLGAYKADYGGADSGSVWVIFGTGTATSGDMALDVSTNYNIRYDGGATLDYLTRDGALTIGDLNGDSLGDLVLGAYGADNNGDLSGSAWVIYTEPMADFRVQGQAKISGPWSFE